ERQLLAVEPEAPARGVSADHRARAHGADPTDAQRPGHVRDARGPARVHAPGHAGPRVQRLVLRGAHHEGRPRDDVPAVRGRRGGADGHRSARRTGQRVRRPRELGGARIPIHGGTGDPHGDFNAIWTTWVPGQGLSEVTGGSSFVQVVTWGSGSCPDTRTILTYSESENPDSPHHDDPTLLFSQKQWLLDRFCESQIS